MHFRRFHLGDKLLCKSCHVAKGAEDRPELAHGTYYVYWYGTAGVIRARRRTRLRAPL